MVVVARVASAGRGCNLPDRDQLFLALGYLLLADFEEIAAESPRWLPRRASACADSVRMTFLRSDLLLWTADPWDFNFARLCDPTAIGGSFQQQAGGEHIVCAPARSSSAAVVRSPNGAAAAREVLPRRVHGPRNEPVCRGPRVEQHHMLLAVVAQRLQLGRRYKQVTLGDAGWGAICTRTPVPQSVNHAVRHAAHQAQCRKARTAAGPPRATRATRRATA